jgi:hypothetical protein
MSGFEWQGLEIGSEMLTSILILGAGVLGCFLGYRLFRLTLAVYGFLLGVIFGGTVGQSLAEGNSAVLLVSALVGGVLGALLLALLYRVGVFVIGAVAGVLLANAAGLVLDLQLQWWAFVICAVIAGALALTFQKVVIILATAALGSWTMVSAGIALWSGQALAWERILDSPPLWERTDLPQVVVFIAWLALAIAGALLQRRGSKGK